MFRDQVMFGPVPVIRLLPEPLAVWKLAMEIFYGFHRCQALVACYKSPFWLCEFKRLLVELMDFQFGFWIARLGQRVVFGPMALQNISPELTWHLTWDPMGSGCQGKNSTLGGPG